MAAGAGAGDGASGASAGVGATARWVDAAFGRGGARGGVPIARDGALYGSAYQKAIGVP